MKKVLAFGTFDPLHEGHRKLFQDARALGDFLTIVIARDSVIASQKNRTPFLPEDVRLHEVAADSYVDEAVLGDVRPETYAVLERADFHILAIGYDQEPSDIRIREILDSVGKEGVTIVRLSSHMPETYKSSLLRDT